MQQLPRRRNHGLFRKNSTRHYMRPNREMVSSFREAASGSTEGCNEYSLFLRLLIDLYLWNKWRCISPWSTFQRHNTSRFMPCRWNYVKWDVVIQCWWPSIMYSDSKVISGAAMITLVSPWPQSESHKVCQPTVYFPPSITMKSSEA